MKIGLLTHYNVNNQGAQLQMISLKQYLESLGHDVYILTYNKDFSYNSEEKKKNSASIKNFIYYFKEYLLKKGFGLTLFNTKKALLHKKMRRKLKMLPFDSENIDCVIIGADEVFSVDVGCNRMMYGYGLKAPAIAYAPSFGKTTAEVLRSHEVYDIVKKGLKSMYAISARDSHTKEMIKAMTGREAPLVCDPVFFYQGANPIRRIIHKPYLLVYSYDRNMQDKAEVREIIMFAKKHKLLTVSCGTYHKWCDMNIVCDSEEWYGYFECAAYVLTDTFHGTVTSIKNHANVAVFIRDNINSFKLQSLLDETGLNSRLLSSITINELEKVFSETVDYQTVNANVEKLVENGATYLKEQLGNLHV